MKYQDTDIEARVLGILTAFPKLVDEGLRPELFSHEPNRRLAEVLLRLRDKRDLTHAAIVRATNGDQVLSALLGALQRLGNLEVELRPSLGILEEYHRRRTLYGVAQEIAELSGDEQTDLAEIGSKAQELVFQATLRLSNREKDTRDMIDESYDDFARRQAGEADAARVKIGIEAIDTMNAGFARKQLAILAARPSMGKTALANTLAEGLAARNFGVDLYSLEMAGKDLIDRLVVGRAEVDGTAFMAKLGNEHEVSRVNDAYNGLFQAADLLKITELRGLGMPDIRARARKRRAQFKQAGIELGMVVIDYLQLIRLPNLPGRTTSLLTGDIVREAREMAEELDAPVLLISQLNREVERRPKKRPQLSDLRESGNIEEFADTVMFLYRDEYYHPESADEKGSRGVAEVIFAKQRTGRTGVRLLEFVPEHVKFRQLDDRRAARYAASNKGMAGFDGVAASQQAAAAGVSARRYAPRRYERGEE